MFKKLITKHELRVRMAEIESPEEIAPVAEVPRIEPDEIADLIKDVVKYTGITVGCVLGGLTILHTISEVIINVSKNSDKDQK
jgi:maleate cis-trans isomerase